MKSVASPMATPGFRLKYKVTLVNWLRWFTACGPSVVFQLTSAFERHEVLAVVGPDVKQAEILRSVPRALSCDLEDHLVLVRRAS